MTLQPALQDKVEGFITDHIRGWYDHVLHMDYSQWGLTSKQADEAVEYAKGISTDQLAELWQTGQHPTDHDLIWSEINAYWDSWRDVLSYHVEDGLIGTDADWDDMLNHIAQLDITQLLD